MNDRVGQAGLRAALAAGAMEAMRKAAQDAKPDRKLAEVKFLPVIPDPELILAPASIIARTPTETGREFPSSRACSSVAPTRWSATTAR